MLLNMLKHFDNNAETFKLSLPNRKHKQKTGFGAFMTLLVTFAALYYAKFKGQSLFGRNVMEIV